MFGITAEQFASAFRWIVTLGVGYMTGAGILTESEGVTLIGIVVGLGTLAWGVWGRRGSKVADSVTGVAKAPTVEQKQALMSAGTNMTKLDQIKQAA